MGAKSIKQQFNLEQKGYQNKGRRLRRRPPGAAAPRVPCFGIVFHHFGIVFVHFGIVLGHFGIVLGSPWGSVWPWGSVCFAILA